MKKLIGTILVLLATNGVAADKVVVVPLIGDTTNYLVERASLVDAFVDLTDTNYADIYTVPNDKRFVLTDMIGYSYGEMSIIEVTTSDVIPKLRVPFEGYSRSVPASSHYKLGSGITFSPGSKVRVFDNGALINSTARYGHLAITGYLY